MGQSRRAFLATLLCSVAGGLVARQARAADPGHAPPQRTPQEVHYQDHPQDVRSCATCTFFTAPDRCQVVTGAVSRDGFCDLFNLAD